MNIPTMPNILAFQWMLIFATFIVAAVSSEEVSIVVEKLAEDEKGNLSCYKCYEFEEHCESLSNKSEVGVVRCSKQAFCKVVRLDLNENLLTFHRTCSHVCVPGCEKAGGYVRCSSCCTTHLCNVDNGAGKIPTHVCTVALAAGLVAVYRYLPRLS